MKLKKLHPNATLPVKGSKGAACLDVTATSIRYLDEDLVECRIGFSAEIDPSLKIVLVPRSSLTKTKWVIQNSPGQGDSDFRGEYRFIFRAFPCGVSILSGTAGYTKFVLKYPKFPFSEGERIGQIYLSKVIETNPFWSDELSETERGSGGFGSTGK